MPPKKRSIRDFFAPAQGQTPGSQKRAPAHPAPAIAPPLREKRRVDDPNRQPQAASRHTPSLPSSSPPDYATSGDTIRLNTSAATTSDSKHPTTPQSSANSSFSKRVVSNGEPIVLNSDSESDSLPDLDWGEPPTKSSPAVHATRSTFGLSTKDSGLRKPPKIRKDERAFSQFVQAAQKNAETERKIAEVKADLEKPLEEEEQSIGIDFSEEALGHAVHDPNDPEKAKRLQLAMQRTNALNTNCVYHFFKEDASGMSLERNPFPLNCLPNHQWTTSFQEQSARDQAFMSGFAQQVFRYQQLPEELASWMIDQVCMSTSDVLDGRYLQLLETHHDHLRPLLHKAKLNSIFNSLGVDPQCLNPLQEAAPSYEPDFAMKRLLPPPLSSACRLLQTAAPWLCAEAGTYALYMLLHLCMDDSVRSDFNTLHVVQDAIEAIICSIPDRKKLAVALDDVVPALLKRIAHPVLQRSLICSLPTSFPLTAYFQRHLALSFLLYPTALEVPLESPEVPKLILTYLQDSPDFRSRKGQNYTSLAARLTLLDVAIGPGLLEVPYEPLVDVPDSRDDSQHISAPVPLTSEKKAFNTEVDALAQQLNALGNSIVETGNLTDLTRLDAKDCCERLYHRLQNAVRIGGKKLNNPFRSEGQEEHATRTFKNWLVPRSRSRSNTPAVGGNTNNVSGDSAPGDAVEATAL